MTIFKKKSFYIKLKTPQEVFFSVLINLKLNPRVPGQSVH